MKIGNSNGTFWYIEEPAAIFTRMKELGYDVADWNIADTQKEIYHDDAAMEAYCKAIKEGAAAAGIEMWQAHGPWPTDDKTPESREIGWGYFHRAVYMCHLAGCPRLVIHPQMPYGYGVETEPELPKELTVGLIRDLLPDCEKYGVTICLENMPFRGHRISTMNRIVEAVAEVNSPYAAICMDTGHVNVFENYDLGDAVRQCAPYLQSFHIHDNDGKRDSHELPWWGTANWDGFVEALAEIDYKYPLILECSGNFPGNVPWPVRDAAEKLTAATARTLAEMVENKKTANKGV